MYSGLSQSIPTNAKITCKQEIVKCTNENNTPSKSIIETKHFHSPQKSKGMMIKIVILKLFILCLMQLPSFVVLH